MPSEYIKSTISRKKLEKRGARDRTEYNRDWLRKKRGTFTSLEGVTLPHIKWLYGRHALRVYWHNGETHIT
jgi:hypothetical protein